MPELNELTALEAVRAVEAKLRELLLHPGLKDQDKAGVTRASLNLTEIERRHMGKWTPCNPAALPPRKAGQGYATLPQGWARDWEDEKEGANA